MVLAFSVQGIIGMKPKYLWRGGFWWRKTQLDDGPRYIKIT